jgi:hypothetical protein
MNSQLSPPINAGDDETTSAAMVLLQTAVDMRVPDPQPAIVSQTAKLASAPTNPVPDFNPTSVDEETISTGAGMKNTKDTSVTEANAARESVVDLPSELLTSPGRNQDLGKYSPGSHQD